MTSSALLPPVPASVQPLATCSDSTSFSVDPTMDPKEEWVLLVPPKLAKSSYAVLVESHCVFRPWHLEGRFGSRTHRHHFDDKDYKIGIPVLSKDHVLQQSTLPQYHESLGKLLQEDGVGFVWKIFTPSNRAVRDPPPFDARIHPERANNIQETAVKPTTDKFTYVDLFAGMGGFAVALDALGGTCLLSSEIDETCQRLYQHNFPEAPLQGDIYKITREQLLQLLSTITRSQGVDLVVGGFPCQPFSALGEQPGIDCPKAGGLFLEIVRLLKTLQPKAFLLENVPGLLAMKDTFQAIKEALEGAGYNVTYEVCNARGLTATSRKRLFLAGFLKQQHSNQTTETNNSTNNNIDGNDPSSSPTEQIAKSTNATNKTFEFPYVPDLRLRARDIIDYTNQELSTMEQDLLPVSDEQLEQLNKGKKWRPAHMAWPNTVCSTLVSHYGNSIARGHSQLVPASASITASDTASPASTNNTNPRRFSPRECLRLMGFPNSYQLPPKSSEIQGDRAFLKDQYRMAGNAVCPPLIAALAGAVLAHSSSNPKWVEYGRQVAVDLAYQATRTGYKPKTDNEVDANSGSLDAGGGDKEAHRSKVAGSTKRPFDSVDQS